MPPVYLSTNLLHQNAGRRFKAESSSMVDDFVAGIRAQDADTDTGNDSPGQPGATAAPKSEPYTPPAPRPEPTSPPDPLSWLPSMDALTANWRTSAAPDAGAAPATGSQLGSTPSTAPTAPGSAASEAEPTADEGPSWLPSLDSLTSSWQALLPKPAPPDRTAKPAPATGASGTPSAMPTAPVPRLANGDQLGTVTIEDGRTPPSAPAPAPAPAELDYSSPEAYRQSLADSAQVVADKYDLPASVIAAIPIQESGFVGSRLGREGNNLFSIKGEGPAGSMQFTSGAAPEDLNTPFRKYNSATESFDDFGHLITTQPRYAKAVEVWQQTRDPARFLEEVQKAGYATDWGQADGTGVPWWQKVVNISKDLPPAQTSAAGDQAPAAQTAAQQAPAPSVQGIADGPDWRKTWGDDLTPDQIKETLALGLDWDTAISTCGIAAAVAFARATGGKAPTFGQMLQLAQDSGEWNKDVGMTHGSAGEVALLHRMGVDAHEMPIDEQMIAKTVAAGRPVQINAQGHGGHFYLAQDVRQGPNGLEFNFGNSAAILKRSGGRTWYRLDELADLNVGTPAGAIVLGGS